MLFRSEANPIYQDLLKKVDSMHMISSKIPESQRIKVFEFDINHSYLDTLHERVEQARVVYASMSLGLDF